MVCCKVARNLHTHGIVPNVHHTFCHMKAMANMVNYADKNYSPNTDKIQLPRENANSIRFFSDVQTWLIAKGKFRATVTGYDREYKDFKNGHPTGGAISMLWHEKTGAILVASMNEYQLFEKDNMQADSDPLSMPLTVRIELKNETGTYANISDLSAQINVTEEKEQVLVTVTGSLVNASQQHPASGEIKHTTRYRFANNKISFHFDCDAGNASNEIRIVFPVVCASDEKYSIAANTASIQKKNAIIKISADKKLAQMPVSKERLFNYVPGMEAVPFAIDSHTATIILEIL